LTKLLDKDYPVKINVSLRWKTISRVLLIGIKNTRKRKDEMKEKADIDVYKGQRF